MAKKQPKPANGIRSIADLINDDRNANKGTERGTGLIEDSLRRLGAGRSVVADKHGRLIAGNKTAQGCRDIGLEKVRVVQTNGDELVVVQRMDLDLDTKAARELAIVDNRAGQVSLEWDMPQLESLATDYGIDLSDVGFSSLDIENLGGSEVPEATEDEAPDPSTVPSRCAAGELWKLGEHRLLCGDSRKAEDVGLLLGGEVINVAVTSPPYASQRKYDESSGFKPIPPDKYVEWWEAVQANVKENLAADGSFFVNIKEHCENGERSLYVKDLTVAHVREWGWKFVDEFVWRKNGTPGAWPNRFRNDFEPVFHFSTCEKIKFCPQGVGEISDHAMIAGQRDVSHSTDAKFSRSKAVGHGVILPGNVLQIGCETAGEHSAPFPVGLPAFFIKAFSDEGDVIYEPFCGSGTTLIAAEQLKRRCYGIEISPTYCDVILARWEKLTGKTAEKISA